MFKKILHYLHERLFYLILLVFATLTVLISPQVSTYYAIISTYLFYYLIYAQAERFFSGLILFVMISLSLYHPIYAHYGEPNTGIIAAFFETNPDEAWTFAKVFNLAYIQLPLIFCLFGYIVLRLKKYHQKGTDNKRILHIALWGVLGFTAIWEPAKFTFDLAQKSELIQEERGWTLLSKSPVNLFSFYVNLYDSTVNYFQEKAALDNADKQPSPWKVTSTTPKYQNYVLVIGESARLDHHSSYGFPLPTTPFLDRTNGYINSGYVSAAPATHYSLLYTLYFKNKATTNKVDYSYHIINLAKSAGFKTVWLSNQGHIGTHDTIASRIGRAADVAEFTKKFHFRMGNESDDKLIELFQAQLHNQPTLFVLHLMGSHQNFCERVDDKPTFDYLNKRLSCYATSILKTDQLLENVVKQLADKQQTYSLIYFADHGLGYVEKKAEDTQKINFEHNQKVKEGYRVPFVKIASDDTQRIVVNTPRSAMRFIEGFAQWLGIESEELPSNSDFFSSQPDKPIKVFNFTELVDFDSLEDDPLIKHQNQPNL